MPSIDPTWSVYLAVVLVQVTVILIAGLIAHQLVGRSSAARYCILFWALLAVGVVPVVSMAVRICNLSPPRIMIPISMPVESQVLKWAVPDGDRTVATTPAAVTNATSPRAFSFANLLFWIWLAGMLVAMARFGLGLLLSWRIRRNAFPLPEEILQPFAESLSSSLGRPTPPILVSDQISVPAAIGCFRSIVLVPPALLPKLNDEQLLSVLLHECAHAIRRDPLVTHYQRLLSAFLWFHPLVYLANRLLDRAREGVCDNYALRASSAADYSLTLVAVAESIPAVPRSFPAPAFFGSKRQLQHRVTGLLNSRRCVMTSIQRWKMGLIAALFLGSGLAIAALGGAQASQQRSGIPDHRWMTTHLAEALALAGQQRTVTSESPNELSRVVHFEVGRTRLRDGDKITIEEVSGTSDTMTEGNMYVVKGTYKLASAKRAILAAYTTANANDARAMQMQSIPDMKTQRVVADQGEGQFKLIFYMWYNGNPHVSFYPAEGGSDFGGVYFGTGDSVWREKNPNR
jgi:beta-lactamase regulating signal transducer with metallopeptidase domain